MVVLFEYAPAGEGEPYSGGAYSWWRGALWEQKLRGPFTGMIPAIWDGVTWFPNIMGLDIYCDADFGGDVSYRKGTTGVFISWADHPIMWFWKLPPVVTTSTTEAEFVAAATAVEEGLLLRKLLVEIAYGALSLDLYCVNQATVKSNSAGVSGRSQHIDIQFMFIRERHHRKEVTDQWVPQKSKWLMFSLRLCAKQSSLLWKVDWY
jgi:hypothetical protein